MQHSRRVFYSGTNFFLPPAPNCLVLHCPYPFLKLSSFSLEDSATIQLADTKCLGHTHMLSISQLGVTDPHSCPAAAAAGRRVCLHGCVRPGEEEAISCSYWDLAEPASGPSKLLLCRVFFLYPLVFSGRERALLPEAIFSLCSGWGMNTEWQSSTVYHSLSQMGALVSASSPCCMFDMINSVSNRVPDTHAVISETASQPAQRPLFKLSHSVHESQLFAKSPCKEHCI